MTELDEHGRPETSGTGDEISSLQGFLEYQRATFAWKCGGLDPAGMTATTAASTMTLGGMMKHLAYVEDWWFSQVLRDRKPRSPWDAVDWDADPDWEWRTAAQDTPEQLDAQWRDSVAHSRAMVAEALAEGGPERPAVKVFEDGRSPSLRWIMLHMIEEYARHVGHADLLRESIDGLTGE